MTPGGQLMLLTQPGSGPARLWRVDPATGARQQVPLDVTAQYIDVSPTR
jgi:hypothetical protein